MSLITAQTTDKELSAEWQAAKERLVAAVADNDAVTLSNYVNDVASAEGAMQARFAVRNALQHGATAEALTAHLTGLVLNGPDDTWSGRGNDARRSKFEGLRNEVRDLTEFSGIERLLAQQPKEA